MRGLFHIIIAIIFFLIYIHAVEKYSVKTAKSNRNAELHNQFEVPEFELE